jgi:hypothetical protein
VNSHQFIVERGVGKNCPFLQSTHLKPSVLQGTAMASLVHMQRILSNRQLHFLSVEKAVGHITSLRPVKTLIRNCIRLCLNHIVRHCGWEGGEREFTRIMKASCAIFPFPTMSKKSITCVIMCHSMF